MGQPTKQRFHGSVAMGQRFLVYRKGEGGNVASLHNYIGEGMCFASNKVVVCWLREGWPLSVFDNMRQAHEEICGDGKTEFVPAEVPR